MCACLAQCCIINPSLLNIFCFVTSISVFKFGVGGGLEKCFPFKIQKKKLICSSKLRFEHLIIMRVDPGSLVDAELMKNRTVHSSCFVCAFYVTLTCCLPCPGAGRYLCVKLDATGNRKRQANYHGYCKNCLQEAK